MFASPSSIVPSKHKRADSPRPITPQGHFRHDIPEIMLPAIQYYNEQELAVFEQTRKHYQINYTITSFRQKIKGPEDTQRVKGTYSLNDLTKFLMFKNKNSYQQLDTTETLSQSKAHPSSPDSVANLDDQETDFSLVI